MGYSVSMKALLLLVTVFSLVSCNTSIGVWRDTKALTSWSIRKVKEARAGNNASFGDQEFDSDQDYEYGAPVY